MAETSCQMLEVLSICDRGEGVFSSTKGNSAKFSSEKWSNEAFRRVHIFRIGEISYSNLVLEIVLFLESKGL